MRFFVIVMVAVLGIGMFAVSALLWDRRRELVAPTGETVAAVVGEGEEPSSPTPAPAADAPSNRRYLPHAGAVAALVLGMAMLIGACAGLLDF